MTRAARRFDGREPDQDQPHTNLHPYQRMCRVGQCSSRVDGDDFLCGYHRALRNGPAELERYRESGLDRMQIRFDDFAERHQDDAWGAAIRIANDIDRASDEDKRELLGFLKLQARRAVRRVPNA